MAMYVCVFVCVMKNRKDMVENNQSSNENANEEKKSGTSNVFNSKLVSGREKNQNKEMKMSGILSDRKQARRNK